MQPPQPNPAAVAPDPRKVQAAAQQQQQQVVNNPVPAPQQDLSVILVTAGCELDSSSLPLQRSPR